MLVMPFDVSSNCLRFGIVYCFLISSFMCPHSSYCTNMFSLSFRHLASYPRIKMMYTCNYGIHCFIGHKIVHLKSAIMVLNSFYSPLMILSMLGLR